MCLIAYANDGKPITRETFDCADAANPDGIGVMTADGFAKFLGKKQRRKAWNYLTRSVFNRGLPYAVHFRWTTHGGNTRDNTHPHLSPDGRFLVMHNGILREFDDPTGVRSDTALFVETWFDDAPDMADTEAWTLFTAETEKYIGSGNKLCALEIASGRFHVFNRHVGDFGTDGIWYSNTYSLPQDIDPYTYAGYNRTRYRSKYDDYDWEGAKEYPTWTKHDVVPVYTGPAKRYRVADTVDRWLDKARNSGLARNQAEQEEARLQAWLKENRARLAASGPAAFEDGLDDDAYTPERVRREEKEASEVLVYERR